ncbi:MAG: hypothetical protein MUC35_03450 [Candidatus Margulisbacteria bacterium]|jgi:hypothetical protein|nr:hypothetical protein [Candidatus Margulisiibacteriota bacterium]
MSKPVVCWLSGLVVGCLLSGCAIEKSPTAASFPDPYVASVSTAEVTFTDLPAPCTIEIYTVSGDLVRSITETDGDGQARWDLKNSGGESLASGLYKFMIKYGSSIAQGKLVIAK